MAPSGKARVPSVERTIRILEMLARATRPLKASEISVRLGLPRTSTHMILRTLESYQYVERRSPRGSYTLGEALARLQPRDAVP